MKKLITLIALLFLSSCYVSYPRYYDPTRTPSRPSVYDRWWWFNDPMYFGYPSLPYYRTPIIIKPAPPTPRVTVPQQPRQYNLNPPKPQQPRSGNSGNAPVRTFPPKDDKK